MNHLVVQVRGVEQGARTPVEVMQTAVPAFQLFTEEHRPREPGRHGRDASGFEVFGKQANVKGATDVVRAFDHDEAACRHHASPPSDSNRRQSKVL